MKGETLLKAAYTAEEKRSAQDIIEKAQLDIRSAEAVLSSESAQVKTEATAKANLAPATPANAAAFASQNMMQNAHMAEMKNFFERSDVFKRFKSESLMEQQEAQENAHLDQDLNEMRGEFMHLMQDYASLEQKVHQEYMQTRPSSSK